MCLRDVYWAMISIVISGTNALQTKGRGVAGRKPNKQKTLGTDLSEALYFPRAITDLLQAIAPHGITDQI